LVLPNGRADQGGTIGNRCVVGAVGIVGRHAHIGQLDKVAVLGAETGEPELAGFAALAVFYLYGGLREMFFIVGLLLVSHLVFLLLEYPVALHIGKQ